MSSRSRTIGNRETLRAVVYFRRRNAPQPLGVQQWVCSLPAEPAGVAGSCLGGSRSRLGVGVGTAMNDIRATERLNAAELAHGLTGANSWHSQYKDSAYVYVGGLSFDLTEGDVIAVMSQ